jgi:hypothetical protein
VSDNRDTYVQTAVIRAMDNPDLCPDPSEEPGAQVFGQIRLTLKAMDDPDIYEALISGHLIRGAAAGVTDASIFLSDSPVLNVLISLRGATESLATLAGSAQIPSALAEVMIEDPDILVARFESSTGPTLCGRFVGDPEI